MNKTDERMCNYAHSPSPSISLPIKEGFKKKVYVYACCKNEAHTIEKYMKWASEADGVFFLDTGSTDGTQEKIKKLGGFVVEDKINPWRFDEAKNKAMNLVPDDAEICICFNLDESMTPEIGWRKILEEKWQGINMARYEYVFSHKSDGSKGVSFMFNAIHDRHSFFWKYPTHEVLANVEGKQTFLIDTPLECHHWRPEWKPKSNDLLLLKMATEEYPDDRRILHYYGRELFYHEKWDEAIEILNKHIKIECWNQEKAASMFMIAISYERKKNFDEAEKWYLRACAEAPEMREFWVHLGRFYMNVVKNYIGGYYAAKRALAISKKQTSHYLCNDNDWSIAPWDILSVCAWYVGLRDEANETVNKVIKMLPNDKRVQFNYKFITENMKAK